MSIVKITSTKDLPSWFKIQNYSSLSLETEIVLYRQIVSRVAILRSLNLGREMNIHDKLEWKFIQQFGAVTGEKIEKLYRAESNKLGLKEFKKDFKDDPALNLRKGASVTPLTARHIARMMMGMMASKAEETGDPFDAFDLRDHKYHIEQGSENTVNITINLRYRDRKILSELEDLLPIYRKSLGSAPPKKSPQKKTPLKILNNKVIPLLDLLIWAKNNNSEISYTVLAVTLFPDGTKGEEELRKTIVPFTLAMTENTFVDEWEADLEPSLDG